MKSKRVISYSLLSVVIWQGFAFGQDRLQPEIPVDAAQTLERGRQVRIDGDPDGAIGLLEGLVGEHPDYYLAQYNLGLAYLNKGEVNEAIPILEKTAQLREQRSIKEYSIYNSLGWAHLVKGDYPAAEKELKTALRHHEDNTPRTNVKVLNNIGVLYMYAGDLDKAESYFRKVKREYGSEHAEANLALLESLRQQKENLAATGSRRGKATLGAVATSDSAPGGT